MNRQTKCLDKGQFVPRSLSKHRIRTDRLTHTPDPARPGELHARLCRHAFLIRRTCMEAGRWWMTAAVARVGQMGPSVVVSRVVSLRRRNSITQTATTPNGELCKFNDAPYRSVVPLYLSAFILFMYFQYSIGITEVRQKRRKQVITMNLIISSSHHIAWRRQKQASKRLCF